MRLSLVLAVVAALAVSISATEEIACAVVCVYDRDCAGCDDSAYRSLQCAPDSVCVVGRASAFTL
ncbi:hypothetical protein CY34DRAFT_799929 [Suillus luteus UH-Slu-Lm8-n1]|uniref:Uncharacterized protein n=1 Tax=Suillus luteus UH-Slu-Lm8-n1 TaxID=930992 RepID=A0A0D0BM61_9AGAM|nr:hypothetical protein CY34DRAFT_799929 [Suillus luteus UH-Slu-Lm8-n1]